MFFWQMSLTWSTTTTARSTSTVSLADESHTRRGKLSAQRNLVLFPWHDQVKGRSFVELSWQLLQINFLWVCRHHHVPRVLKYSNPLEWFLPYNFIFLKMFPLQPVGNVSYFWFHAHCFSGESVHELIIIVLIFHYYLWANSTPDSA